MSWQRATICLHRSRLHGTYIFPWNQSRPSMFDHSEEYTSLLAEPWSSRTVFAIDFSWSLLRFSLWMSDKILCSSPVNSTPSRVCTAMDSSQRRTMFLLSNTPFPWSALLDNVSVTNFIRPYLHQFFKDFHSLNSYGKPLKRTFNQCQSHLKAINIGWDIRQINW